MNNNKLIREKLAAVSVISWTEPVIVQNFCITRRKLYTQKDGIGVRLELARP